jgi:hypothetical protein
MMSRTDASFRATRVPCVRLARHGAPRDHEGCQTRDHSSSHRITNAGRAGDRRSTVASSLDHEDSGLNVAANVLHVAIKPRIVTNSPHSLAELCTTQNWPTDDRRSRRFPGIASVALASALRIRRVLVDGSGRSRWVPVQTCVHKRVLTQIAHLRQRPRDSVEQRRKRRANCTRASAPDHFSLMELPS